MKIDRILWALADAILVQGAAITRRVWRFIRFILVLNNRTAIMAVWIIAAVQLLGVMFTENAGSSSPHVWRLLAFVAAALTMNAAFPMTASTKTNIAVCRRRRKAESRSGIFSAR